MPSADLAETGTNGGYQVRKPAIDCPGIGLLTKPKLFIPNGIRRAKQPDRVGKGHETWAGPKEGSPPEGKCTQESFQQRKRLKRHRRHPTPVPFRPSTVLVPALSAQTATGLARGPDLSPNHFGNGAGRRSRNGPSSNDDHAGRQGGAKQMENCQFWCKRKGEVTWGNYVTHHTYPLPYTIGTYYYVILKKSNMPTR